MEGAIKKNADAELAFNTAHSLILKLAQHKAKASPDPPQVSLFKIYIYHIQRFVSSTGNMEVLLSHTHSILCALAYFIPKWNTSQIFLKNILPLCYVTF